MSISKTHSGDNHDATEVQRKSTTDREGRRNESIAGGGGGGDGVSEVNAALNSVPLCQRTSLCDAAAATGIANSTLW